MTKKQIDYRKYCMNKIDTVITQYKQLKIRVLTNKSLKKTTKERYLKFVNKVEHCINSLGPKWSDIFKVSFIDGGKYFLSTNYSRSQFYKIRKESYMRFVYLFNNGGKRK